MRRSGFLAGGRLVRVAAMLAASGMVMAGTNQDRTVEAAAKPGKPWQAFPVRVLEDLPATIREAGPKSLDQYGGWRDIQLPATGFFYTTNREGRWWFVDPEGHRFLQAGVAATRTIPTPGARAALQNEFGSLAGWAQATVALFRTNGFNSLGCWSDAEALRSTTRPLAYTRIWNFMSRYGRHRGGTFQQAGHVGYPSDCIFVFDPEFESFCDDYARQLAASKDDPWLIGHFSDNEMPFKREALRHYLDLPAADPGRVAAQQFLSGRHGDRATVKDITPQDEQDFLELVVGRYFQIVSRAIKRHDPNHLFLGSRFYGADLRHPEVFRAAGPHVDVVSVNWYHAWTPKPDQLALWARESGRPVLITEWYAKGEDSGMGNTSGAGWLVRTQRDRGLFYEHFTLALLESPVCVGWHWFRYADNDPDDKGVDPSNRDANKGMVNNRYAPYAPLLASMKRINTRLYPLADYFCPRPGDGKYQSPPTGNRSDLP
jgi:hypothetical protein